MDGWMDILKSLDGVFFWLPFFCLRIWAAEVPRGERL